jgi:pimeloyl-ACP methyl ester carboxylesterase
MKRWRGMKSLVHDAVDRVTDLVGEGHESSARNVMRVTDRIDPVAKPARTVDRIRRVTTAGVLRSVKIVNRAVEIVTDGALDLLAPERATPTLVPAVPMRSDAMLTGAVIGDAAIGLVNAGVGDHLARRGNGLDMGMTLRAGDYYVACDPEAISTALPRRMRKLALFVHGLGTTEWCWCLEALAYHGDATATFGTLLERDLGFTPIYLRYNTGRHVSENGRDLADLLERFAESYERTLDAPVDEIALVGHSMGGLVVRSACHYASEAHHRWVERVRRVICLGTPHQGAPLEKFGNVITGALGAIDLPGTLVSARILEARSAGIKDLRHGSLVDDDWLDKDPDALVDDESRRQIPLLPRVAYHFVSATVTRDPEHPLGRLVGDLLVRVPSASGPLAPTSFAIDTARFGGVMHHQLQNHPAVYEVVRRACSTDREPDREQ